MRQAWNLFFLFAMSALATNGLAADYAPALQWVTTLGASGQSLMAAAGSDGHGNLYITGVTTAIDFPVTVATWTPAVPNKDVFAVKLDQNGNVVYSIRFGGSGSDVPAALAVGADGSVYIAGSTTSTDLPVTAGAYLPHFPATQASTASFVFKLNSDGSPAWATYFPGQGIVQSIAVDSTGDVFLGGY